MSTLLLWHILAMWAITMLSCQEIPGDSQTGEWFERRTRWQCETMSLHHMICEPKSSACLSPAKLATHMTDSLHSGVSLVLCYKPNTHAFSNIDRSWNFLHRAALKNQCLSKTKCNCSLSLLCSIEETCRNLKILEPGQSVDPHRQLQGDWNLRHEAVTN